MDKILSVFRRDSKLQEVMQAPMLNDKDKKEIVKIILQQSGAQDKGDVLKNFLETLVENNRLAILEPVCEKFGTLMSAYRGEVELVVTSAAVSCYQLPIQRHSLMETQPLDQRVLRQLEQAVSKSQYVGQGKKLKVVPKVNPDIRGGLIVEIGDRTIDLSVAQKMSRMNKLLREQL
jgi:F-type H+-transporting ATPase subunit O